MCKPSCCAGNSGGSGLGALAAIAAIVFIAAIARPVIHAAETMLRVAAEIAAITLSIIVSLAMISVAVFIATRLRRNRHNTAPLQTQRAPAIIWPATPVASLWRPSRRVLQARPQLDGIPAGHRERDRSDLQLCPGCAEVMEPAGADDHDWRWP